MTTDTSVDIMSWPTCEAFLANESVGRLAVVVDEMPHIVPLNYVAEGSTIVFRTGPDTILTEASLRKVAFEVDSVHERHRTGWSVCVHGYGREITGCVDPESVHLQQLIIDCWAPGPRDRWFKIIPATLTGRYLSAVHPGSD